MHRLIPHFLPPMRIIAGRLRRRTLLTNPGVITRPITDRVKESLFERLRDDLVEARVADIFCGTGTMGFEALSRGASRVTFIEKDFKAIELLRQNVAALKVTEESIIWPADVLRCSFKPKNAEGFTPFDLIFFDPPYKMVEAIRKGSPLFKSLERLATNAVSSPGALLLLRTPDHAEFELPSAWQGGPMLTMSNMTIHRLEKHSDHRLEKHSDGVNE